MKTGIKIISAKYLGDYRIEIKFSDGKVRMWRFTSALRRQCSSLDGGFS